MYDGKTKHVHGVAQHSIIRLLRPVWMPYLWVLHTQVPTSDGWSVLVQKAKNDPIIKASFRAFASRIFNDQALEETDQMQ